jgi:hypothetical protein
MAGRGRVSTPKKFKLTYYRDLRARRFENRSQFATGAAFGIQDYGP